jgi:hypothetical protein
MLRLGLLLTPHLWCSLSLALALSNDRKRAEAFDRLSKLHIVRDHKGMLVLNETFRKKFKSALTGG